VKKELCQWNTDFSISPENKVLAAADMAPAVGSGLIPTYIIYLLGWHYFSDYRSRGSIEPLPVILRIYSDKKRNCYSESRNMNYLLTGLPKSGKTTIIKKLVQKLEGPAGGFFTEEIKEDNIRVGFSIRTLSGKEGILSHKNFKSKYRVGKYGVGINTLDKIGVKEIEDSLEKGKIIIIDEIGKMELFSKGFQDVVWRALESKNPLVATIIFVKHPFADKVKKRTDVKVFEVTKKNRNELVEVLVKKLKKEK